MDRLIKTGTVPPKSAKDIAFSRLGIGFEKLDRNVFDPRKAYDKLAAIGVKHVRIQSGWQRTETVKGVYDFVWIDAIVDRLIADGMEPWVCLCYGNPLYSEEAKEVFGSVGIPPIRTEEEKAGWAAYVTAFVRHFRGRVKDYEVWNEPDGKHCWRPEPDPTEYGQFVVDTAAAVKAADPAARVIACAICRANLTYIAKAAETGMLDAADALSYHCYTPNDKVMRDSITTLKALVERYKPGMPVIQGESGTQSRSGGHGALRTGAWTEHKQAKYLARHLITDLWGGAEFTSYFSTMDMIEALRGINGDVQSYLDYGYFGVLGAQFDENGFSVGDYAPKPSYRTLQTLCSVFEGEWKPVNLPVISRPGPSGRVFGNDVNDFQLQACGFERPDGSCAYVYWYAADMLTSDFYGTVTFHAAALGNEVRLVDLYDGTIYDIPDTILTRVPGGLVFQNMPVTDRPMMLEFGKFIH